MRHPKLKLEKWVHPITSSCNSGAIEIGTIRTIPENYFVAVVDDRGQRDFTLRFRPGFEPMTDDVDKDYVIKWFGWAKGIADDKIIKERT